MKRRLTEYSSDLDTSSPLGTPDDAASTPLDKRARSEERNATCYTPSFNHADDGVYKSQQATDDALPLTKVTVQDGQSLLLTPQELHPSNLPSDPDFYSTTIFHFDFASALTGRKNYEQWAASLGDELARHVRMLKFTLVKPLEMPHEAEVSVLRGSLTYDDPSAVLRKNLARVDEQCVGTGFGVNGLIATGRFSELTTNDRPGWQFRGPRVIWSRLRDGYRKTFTPLSWSSASAGVLFRHCRIERKR